MSENPIASAREEPGQMLALYRRGGQMRGMPPHVVYVEALCPHLGCGQHTQAIDFRVEAYGPAIHDPLVRAWWSDVGFAGRCPKCGGRIHFTIRDKRAISAEQAAQLPTLPEDWHEHAVIR